MEREVFDRKVDELLDEITDLMCFDYLDNVKSRFSYDKPEDREEIIKVLAKMVDIAKAASEEMKSLLLSYAEEEKDA